MALYQQKNTLFTHILCGKKVTLKLFSRVPVPALFGGKEDRKRGKKKNTLCGIPRSI